MNKIICLIVIAACCLQLSAQTTFTALKLTPEFPKPNSKLDFEYNQNYSPLIKLPKIDIVVYQFNDKGLKVTEPLITKKGTLHSGSFLVDSNTNCIAFGFSSGEEKDINNSKGYIVPVYGKNNVPVENYYKAAGSLYLGYGEYLFGLPADALKALAYLQEGFKQYPALKSDANYFDSYLNAISSSKKKEEAEALIKAELREFESRGNLTEAGYSTLIRWYIKDKKNEKADSLTALMKSLHPEGSWKREEMVNNFFNESDLPKRIAIYNDFITRYTSEVDKPMIETMKSRIAMAYGKKKEYTSYEEWSKGLGNETLHSINNNLAWSMVEAGEDLAQAKLYSYAATTYAKNEMLKPTVKKTEDQSTKDWTDQRRAVYGMYADTYAFILYKLGDYKEGLPYAKEAVAIYEKNAEYNERYALLAEKALPVTQAKTTIEKMVRAGLASSKTKEVLKNLYIKEKKTERGFENYLEALEADAKNKKRTETAKSIINEAAPAFELKDMDGNLVSLNGLKGKILVVDFWATWCGPCIASMPGMNKAVAKFKDNKNIQFLFIDTWESGENKLQNAKDFMDKKNYPFQVLMDNDNEMVKDFNVRGIPTKFIIDKMGRIRFKAIGFGGNDDALVEELTTMIELAGN